MSKLVVASIMTLVLTPGLQAQGSEPVRHEDVTWYQVLRIQFVPSEAAGAMELLERRIVPAAVDARIPPALIVQHVTGPWDLSLFFPMSGPDDLAWVTSPRDLAFRQALAAREGGQEAALSVLSDFQRRIGRQERDVVMMRTAGSN